MDPVKIWLLSVGVFNVLAVVLLELMATVSVSIKQKLLLNPHTLSSDEVTRLTAKRANIRSFGRVVLVLLALGIVSMLGTMLTIITN